MCVLCDKAQTKHLCKELRRKCHCKPFSLNLTALRAVDNFSPIFFSARLWIYKKLLSHNYTHWLFEVFNQSQPMFIC